MMIRISFLFLLWLILLPDLVFARSPLEEQDLTRAFGNEEFISIATGTRQPISHAPAVASVITEEDIEAIGATDLDEILETVPGLHVAVAPRLYTPIYTIRGIYTENNPQVLILINDIPITNIFIGNRSDVWGGMPVNNIKRIEVVRGPGSAVYGADAFSGTINIITKTPDDINGTEFGARAGSFDMREGWILHGGHWGGFDTALSVQLKTTDGQDRTLEYDAQTALDTIYSTSASLAPGPVNLGRDSIDTRLDISRGTWKLRLGYQGRRDVETGAGVALALDPSGTNDSDRINADLTYKTNLYTHWDVTGQLSYLDTTAESNLVLYPPGAFGGAFPDGMIGNPYVYERHTRVQLSSLYHGWDRHLVRLGVGYIYQDMYKATESKNFAPSGAPLGSVVDVTNDPNSVFIRPHDRDINYFFAQDEWSMAPDWQLTGGIRFDHYSDFGNTTNPRLALVWQTRYNLTTKLLYGRAFRAPAFNELYNINNPVALGNPDLKPEEIDTYEIAFNYQPSSRLTTRLNLFRYRMSDILRFVADPAPATTVTAQNTGDQHGQGLEIETEWTPNRLLTLVGNYSYQNSTEEDTGEDVSNAPQQQVYLRLDSQILPTSSLHTQVNWLADREYSPGFSGPDIDNYTLVDLTWRYHPIGTRWAFALSARNVFDEDAREPSTTPASIPNGLPLAGRHFYLEATYQMSQLYGG